jgi:glucose/arabinose dehydrogenase
LLAAVVEVCKFTHFAMLQEKYGDSIFQKILHNINHMKTIWIVLLTLFLNVQLPGQERPIYLDKINLPDNYHIEVYADNVENARGLDFAPDGTLFAGSRNKGNLYAIKEGKVYLLDKDLAMPTGVDYYEGDLYVGAISTIYKYPDILSHLDKPKREVVTDQFPSDRWHGWKYLRFSPDDKLYVPVGAACNVCDSVNPIYATINTINKDGSGSEIYAHGVRNTVGFDFHPVTGELWFTDNGRDMMGDDIPPDELNHAPQKGLHFGFPYFHGAGVEDPEFWDKKPDGLVITKPKLEIQAHSAAIGMRFYTGEMFEAKYLNGAFIAEHGSWNRSRKVGYVVSFARIENNEVVEYEVFASGWLQGEDYWGRPADVAVGLDGALYVSDDFANCIYRIYYEK